MPENKDEQIEFEVEIEEIGRERHHEVRLRALAREVIEVAGERRRTEMKSYEGFRFQWYPRGGTIEPLDLGADKVRFCVDERTEREASVTVALVAVESGNTLARSRPFYYSTSTGQGHGPPPDRRLPLPVQLTRPQSGASRDLILWTAIRYSTASIKFASYARFIDYVLCGDDDALPQARDLLETDDRGVFSVGERVVEGQEKARRRLLHDRRSLRNRALAGTLAYQALREATDAFLQIYCGILPPEQDFARIEADLAARVGTDLRAASGAESVQQAWNAYTVRVHGAQLLPYINILRERLNEPGRHHGRRSEAIIDCAGFVEHKLEYPCFIELIWSYWQEEGMLVQSLNAIANRFQNRRGRGLERDPLINLEIDALRPLNNLLWGYVQDDLNRLSVARRAAEYAHLYGLPLEGRAVARLRVADHRSKFLSGFHNFLQRCLSFFKQDDDTTVHADGFPVLNAIKEVHYLLGQGAQNQFGDLPSTARAEMLIQQWLLSRPEMREFLGARAGVPYPEPWMDRVDAMKSLQGWTDTSVVHFNDLATFGEQIVLGLRYGGWSLVTDPAAAANFAREWRAEIRGYECAYRAVTGVDLGAEVTSQQSAEERDLPPSVHLKRRLAARRGA